MKKQKQTAIEYLLGMVFTIGTFGMIVVGLMLATTILVHYIPDLNWVLKICWIVGCVNIMRYSLAKNWGRKLN